MPDSDFAGVVSGCTVEDRPALWDLCKANHPLASSFDVAATLKDADFGAWAVYRDHNQTIRVAVLMHPNGAVQLMMKAEDISDPEVKQGFLQLARQVHKAFKLNGITDLTILCPKRLKPFVDLLYSEGFLSSEVYTIHGMHFTERREIDRTQ